MNDAEVIQKLKQFIVNSGVEDEIRSKWPLFSGIVKEMKKESHLDRDTSIYRLAMTIYHAKRVADTLLISLIEDPAAIYLQISERDPELMSMIQEEMKKIAATATMETVKTLIAFLIAAYVYLSVESEVGATTASATK